MTAQAQSKGEAQWHSSRHCEDPLVIIVDDDESMRRALNELILSAGMKPVSFASTQELLASDVLSRPGCLILDVRMPGTSGLDLQTHLRSRGVVKPIVFLTAHGDIPMTVQAMKAGAVDFLTKPVRDQTLLDAVLLGLERDLTLREQADALRNTTALLETLTRREHDVLSRVAQGRLNKQIAFDLGITEVTVKLHRSNAMRKMRVARVADLIRKWECLPSHLQVPRANAN